MKKLFFVLLVIAKALSMKAQQGYALSVELKPYKDTIVYLGYYYGSKNAVADSVRLDGQSRGVFKGDKSLPGGIYFLVTPKKEYMFDVLIGKQQHFSIAADSADLPGSVVFTGSDENTLFQQYTNFANVLGTEMNNAKAEMEQAKTKEDSAAVRKKLQDYGNQLEVFRDSMTRLYPESLMAMLFRAMKEPEVPPASEHPGGKYNNEFAYRYYRSHYWDGISFDDERLVRTPFFEAKLERFFKDLVPPAPDSIIKEADHMILFSRGSDEMYQYLMVHFVQKYINPDYMGQDAVFVHLFEKYINTGQTTFFTDEYMEYMKKRAYSLMANLIGLPASDLDMVDSTGKPTPLYGVKANMVLVCFWDPNCSHCKETVPRIDSIHKAKWKNLGVALYGVMTDGGKDKWVQYIREHKLTGWYHVHQLPSKAKEDEKAQRPSYKQLYDVYQTPTLFLLDKDKRILAKKLTFQQMDEIITIKSKKTGAK